jgi:hypothetical protein
MLCSVIGNNDRMGTLWPDDFSLESLKTPTERHVVTALCEQLNDGWVVIPNVELSGTDRDYEIDIVIAHQTDGIAVIEVKGHQPVIKNGQWYAHGSVMHPQPLSQAKTNSYELRDRARRLHPSLSQLRVEYAVAFPNVDVIDGHLPDDAHPSQVLTCTSLEHLRDSINELMFRRLNRTPLGEIGRELLINLLLPNSEVHWETETRTRLARLRLEALSDQQVGALASLDLNQRVCVTGAAGSGKTRLAVKWAGRGLLRDGRTLLTCFNVPLAARLRERITPNEHLVVGPFYEVARNLHGIPPLDVPADADRDWWEHVLIDHLRQYWHHVTERFATIVIDEAQDFSPGWIELLSELLTPDGRLLMVADPSQGIYARDFHIPTTGFTLCELTDNCRNTVRIASMLEQQFNGGKVPAVGPETEDITWLDVVDVDAAVEAVGEAIDRILDERDHSADTVFVGTFTSSVRDRLRHKYGMVAWEDLDPMDILCENVHRVKGLEYDHVILVAHDDHVSDELLYVGASRAVMSLTVIGPSTIGQRMGLS